MEFVEPRHVAFEDCDFYHSVEIPGRGLVKGQSDLRVAAGAHLGNYPFAGKRVLEIGPASGFLTFEMERRGAEVVALEIADDGWNLVPYPASVIGNHAELRAAHIARIKNSFWFLHQLNGSKARVVYGDPSRMPSDIGKFDVALLASVLLHTEQPPRILAECAAHADTIIVTEPRHRHLGRQPVMRLIPRADHLVFDGWWQFTPEFFQQYLGVLGLTNSVALYHSERSARTGRMVELFTVVGSRNELPYPRTRRSWIRR